MPENDFGERVAERYDAYMTLEVLGGWDAAYISPRGQGSSPERAGDTAARNLEDGC